MVTSILANNNKTLYQCEACGLRYEDKAIAKQCQAWCTEHQSCNLEIIKHAVKDDSAITS